MRRNFGVLADFVRASLTIAGILVMLESVTAAKEPVDGYKHRVESRKERLKIAAEDRPAETKAVEASLQWLMRHQNPDGSWTLNEFKCRDGECSCDGTGDVKSDSAATGFALLPFLAEGYSTDEKSPYQQTVRSGVNWLMSHQKPTTGDLSAGGAQVMYSHGIASIALCEASGLSSDRRIKTAAQAALNFIVKAQTRKEGTWGYVPYGDHGDTSVFGWQLTALKAGQAAGLEVPDETWEGATRWLIAVGKGKSGGLYCYQKAAGPSPTMTTVGGLCHSLLNQDTQSDRATESSNYLLTMLPHSRQRNCYYWHYGSQLMHQVGGDAEKKWQPALQKLLLEQQVKDGCSKGSWSPVEPIPDPWGRHGGRIVITSIHTLGLQTYRHQVMPKAATDSSEDRRQIAISQAGWRLPRSTRASTSETGFVTCGDRVPLDAVESCSEALIFKASTSIRASPQERRTGWKPVLRMDRSFSATCAHAVWEASDVATTSRSLVSGAVGDLLATRCGRSVHRWACRLVGS